MKVAIFTDNDFAKVNGVTTTLRAVLRHSPASMDLRVYTCDSAGIEAPEYLGLAAPGVGIPYYRDTNPVLVADKVAAIEAVLADRA